MIPVRLVTALVLVVLAMADLGRRCTRCNGKGYSGTPGNTCGLCHGSGKTGVVPDGGASR